MDITVKWALGFVVLVVAGLFFIVTFDVAMKETSTDGFCLGCHNHEIPYNEYKLTPHYSNAAGVSASCADCHVPHDLGPKIMRKAAAAKEVWGHFEGVIDTDEKYLAHREKMKASELERMRASDSAECRNCHQRERMNVELQSRAAQKAHIDRGADKTCVDCHAGLVHTSKSEEDDFGF